MRLLTALFFALGLASCSSDGVGVEGLNQEVAKPQEVLNFGKLPLKNHLGQLTAVIEIPAGTSHKYEYNYDSNKFECEIINGKERIVKFLPYPGNYGFLPGTLMDKERGGDGDALDVLVLGEAAKQGTIIPIKAIGIVRLLDRGEEDHKIVAVPINEAKNTLGIHEFSESPKAVLDIVSLWFESYKGPGKMEFQGWDSDSLTNIEIMKWAK